MNDELNRNNRNQNLLFVCQGGQQRSPTFESWFKKNKPQYSVKSAGILFTPFKLLRELFEWADTIYVMDLEQEMFIDRKFPEYINKVMVIGCSDDYRGESPQLVRLIDYWAKKMRL